MIGILLRLLLVLVVVHAVMRLVQGVFDGARSMAGRAPQRGPLGAGRREQAVALVKDPVCGTYLVKARAVAAGRGGEVQYFCSERCRDAWIADHAGRHSA